MSGSMPNYKNPPVQEAVCEFQFVPPKGNPEWDLTLPGKLQLDPSLSEYSGASRQQHVQAVVAGSQKGEATLSLQTSLFRIHIPTKDDKALLSLGHNILGVVVLKPYEGWGRFQPRIVAALEVFSKMSGLTTVNRLGVRYINRIVAPVPDASTASEFLTGLQTNIHVTEAGNKSANTTAKLTALNMRQEFITPDGIKLFITHGTLNPQNKDTAEYLLDIDTVWDKEPLAGQDKIMPMVERLHALEGAAFESLITEKARKLFNA